MLTSEQAWFGALTSALPSEPPGTPAPSSVLFSDAVGTLALSSDVDVGLGTGVGMGADLGAAFEAFGDVGVVLSAVLGSSRYIGRGRCPQDQRGRGR